ncbi:MAG: hypothetical protein L0196_08370 [candidate division Zixibacteria bacterium]|nr:hypothetical protein [candidate division Zixibacteria bacterium]
MFRRVLLQAVATLLFAVFPFGLSAQVSVPVEPNCLQKVADQVSPKKKITVVIQDGSEVKGRLVSIDLSQSHLTFQPSEQTLSLYRISRVAKIQHRKIGPESVAKGVLFGAMVGGFLSLPIWLANDDDSWNFGAAVGGSFIVAGAGIGLVAGFTQPTVHTIECK